MPWRLAWRSGKRALLLAGFMSVWPATAVATSTRLRSLGGDGDYFEDNFNVVRWYGSLADFGDLAVIELGDILHETPSGQDKVINQGAALHYDLDRGGRWGTAALYLTDADAPCRTPGDLLLMFSRACGAWQLGAAFGLLKFQRSSDVGSLASPADLQERWLDRTVGLGLRRDLGARLYVDVAIQSTITERSYRVDAARLTQRKSWQSYGWRARCFYGVAEQLALVPLLEFGRSTFLAYSPEITDLADFHDRVTRLGLGLDFFPDSDHFLLASIEQRWQEQDTWGVGVLPEAYRGQELTANGAVLRLGLESRIWPWVTLRAAARQDFRDTRSRLHDPVTLPVADGAAIADSERDPELDLTLGLALHLASYTVDVLFSADEPFCTSTPWSAADQDADVTFSSITLSGTF